MYLRPAAHLSKCIAAVNTLKVLERMHFNIGNVKHRTFKASGCCLSSASYVFM